MGLFDSLFGSSSKSSSKSTTKYALPQATPLQALGESGLTSMLQGWSPTGYGNLAGATTGLMQGLLGSGLNATPEQKALLQGQTSNFMEGLKQTLNDYRQSAMNRAQHEALSRGIPLSDIARGGEANVDAQVLKQLSQGYTQAKGMELQNMLNLPFQNLGMMSQLQQAYNNPYMNMLNALAMSRLTGPRDVTQTGTSTGTQTPSLFSGLEKLAPVALTALGGMFGGPAGAAAGAAAGGATAGGMSGLQIGGGLSSFAF